MIHIAAPFYPKDLRLLVQRLKREKRLKEGPLFRVDLGLLFMGWTVYILLFHFGKLTVAPINLLFAFILFSLIEKWIVNGSANRLIILHSIGTVMDGIVCSEPTYGRTGSDTLLLNPFSKAWRFEYRVTDKKFPEALKEKIYVVKNLRFKDLPYSLYKAGKELKVLVNPNNPDINTPLFLRERRSSSIVKDEHIQEGLS